MITLTEPKQVGIAGAPAGYNTKFSVAGYGSHVVRTDRIATTVHVISSEAASAQAKTFYPHIITSDSFSLAVVFLNWNEREATAKWFRTYMEKITRGEIPRGSMLVQIPARRFVWLGVPEGTLTYGDDVSQAGRAYKLNLSFAGATDPTNVSSSFNRARKDWEISSAFYPVGSQVAGAESLAGTIFDATPLAASTVNTTFSQRDRVLALLGDRG